MELTAADLVPFAPPAQCRLTPSRTDGMERVKSGDGTKKVSKHFPFRKQNCQCSLILFISSHLFSLSITFVAGIMGY